MTIIRATDMNLSDRDLARAAKRFGLTAIEPLGGYENALYRSTDPPGRVLRITHTSRRTIGMIEGEFAFMNHLATRGVPVVAPVLSTDQNVAEVIETDDGQSVLVACMTEAPGGRKRSSDWSAEEIERYGALLGAMHAAADSFEPVGRARRPSWQDPIFDVGLGSARDTEPDLFRRQQEIVAAGAAHWSGADQLLIHCDAHLGNLFVTDDGEITIFDFDDSAYGTATHDVAIVLFYWVLGLEGDLGDAIQKFIGPFLAGYDRHARLPADWAEGADLFLSCREIDIYWLFYSEPADESSVVRPRFMLDRRRRILEGVPYFGAPIAELL